MEAHKKKIWLMAGLSLLAVVVWVRGLTSRPSSGGGVSLPAPSGVPVEEKTQESASFPEGGEWGGNPFDLERRTVAPPVSPVGGEEPSHVASGILWDPKSPSAIVDNRVVSAGDSVGRWQVVEIQKDKVVLSDGVSTQTLSVD
ncbi:MAG: hypothetical protein HYZ90_06755 [Candidatus Omnitrophica bacterium]|nr:hypothetical protein [Candidatus Omnitrophota bacterium]